MYYELFLDMDEVIYDLSNLIRERVNKDFNKNFPIGFNELYWWQSYGIEKEYFESLLQEEGTFYDGKPIDGSVEYINKLHEDGFKIHILTYPQFNKHCFFEKVKFIRQFFPWLDIDTNFHTTGNKCLMARENRILVDDNIGFLTKWEDMSGIGIAFGNYGWNKNWRGILASDWEKTYEIIHILERTSRKWRKY